MCWVALPAPGLAVILVCMLVWGTCAGPRPKWLLQSALSLALAVFKADCCRVQGSVDYVVIVPGPALANCKELWPSSGGKRSLAAPLAHTCVAEIPAKLQAFWCPGLAMAQRTVHTIEVAPHNAESAQTVARDVQHPLRRVWASPCAPISEHKAESLPPIPHLAYSWP